MSNQINFNRTSKTYLELSDIRTVIRNFRKDYRKLDDQQVDQEIQLEISQLIILLQRIEKLITKYEPGNHLWSKLARLFNFRQKRRIREELNILIEFLEVALESLIQEVPNLHTARSICIEVDRTVCRYEHSFVIGLLMNRFKDVQRSQSTPVKVLSGLMSALVVNVSLTLGILSGLFIYVIYTNTNNPINQQLQKINAQVLNLNQELASRGVFAAFPEFLQSPKDSESNSNPTSPALESSNSTEPSNTINPPLLLSSSAQESFSTPEAAMLYRQNYKQIQSWQSLKNNYSRLEEVRATEDKETLARISTILHIVLVISAGTLGSIISILIRIEEFQSKKYPEPLMPFFVGAFKPIIGASFGLLFFALISSEVVTIPSLLLSNNVETKKAFLIFAISFVVGFSERLATDAIGKAEGILSGGQEIPEITQRTMESRTATVVSALNQEQAQQLLGRLTQEAGTPETAIASPPPAPTSPPVEINQQPLDSTNTDQGA